MKLSEFILLDQEEKKLTVLHEGVLIAKRNNDKCFMFLFQMESYYVETYCNLQSKNIEEFLVFDSLKPLEPYLALLPIDDLLN